MRTLMMPAILLRSSRIRDGDTFSLVVATRSTEVSCQSIPQVQQLLAFVSEGLTNPVCTRQMKRKLAEG